MKTPKPITSRHEEPEPAAETPETQGRKSTAVLTIEGIQRRANAAHHSERVMHGKPAPKRRRNG